MVAGTPAPEPKNDVNVTLTVSNYDKTTAKIDGTIVDPKLLRKIIKLTQFIESLDNEAT